jgi:hypothetical protein
MREALSTARAQDATLPSGRQHTMYMARAHAELADSLLDSWDRVPMVAIFTLHREALLWLLSEDEAAKRALTVAIETSPQSFLSEPAEDGRTVRLRHLLAMQSQLGPGQASHQEQRQVAKMTASSIRALLEQTDTGGGTAERAIRRKRRRRLGLAALGLLSSLLALAGVVLWVFTPKDLAQGRPWHVSSTLQAMYSAKVLFHTNEEMNPWFEIDLLQPTWFHRIKVKNRADCCFERAAPLLVETSDDRGVWREIARREAAFAQWETAFPRVRARYVRFRVPKFSALHFEQVQIY